MGNSNGRPLMKPKGKHPHNRLNDKSVKAASPGYHADGNGLYLVVDESGARRWALRTTIRGKRRELGLGGYPLVPLSDARQEALEMRRVARKGEDPIAERHKRRKSVPTFAEAAHKVHADKMKAWRNGKHAAQWINTLEQYAFPTIGNRPLHEIDTPDILNVLSPIWLEKPETARRVRQRIASVMSWAKAAGHRSGENPVDGVAEGLPKHKTVQKHFAALPYAEVPQFISDLGGTDVGLSARLAFEFLILTAGRTNEVLGAQRKEIDKAIWTVPAERMKGERKHRVPLSDRCLEIIIEAEAISDGGPFLFPGAITGKPLSNMVFLMTLRRMGIEVTAHGFRSAFRDWSAERTHFPHQVCEMALAHTIKDKAEAAYRRGDMIDKRRELMAAWAAFVTSDGADVIPLPAAEGKPRAGIRVEVPQ